MRTNYRHTVLLLALLAGSSAIAQTDQRFCSSMYLQPQEKADVYLPFRFSDEGKRFQPTWGLDQAWISEQNMRKGINHMGKDNVGIGRSAFRMTLPLTADGKLQGELITKFRERSNILALASPNLPVVLTADQEAGTDESYVKNSSANVSNWSALIDAHVNWLQANTKLKVAGVSPFNEPDYWTKEEGATTAKQREVAKMLREYYHYDENGIAIVGGNTLNNDKAWDWYSTGKQYYDWGNTHQLAGSFANFADFFKKVSDEGKVAYADEMHNVGEAMIGLEYGMTVGIWWGFDSRARGEFCDISRHGVRLAYGEQRSKWTAASVYRHDDGRVKAFVGSSERQANTTTYQFVSPERDVYFDGQGPLREFRMEMPGGTGYQKGQTNAERVIDVTWGEDVAPSYIADGIYKIVNKATGYVAAVSGSNIAQQKYSKSKAQQWHVHPCDPRIGGDYSFYDIESVSNSKTRMNIQNFSTEDKANVMAYSQNTTPSSNEQWYLEYAGDGYYYIRNRETAHYLTLSSSVKATGQNIYQRPLQTDDTRDRQLWRFLPLDVDYETVAPAQPSNLLCEPASASVKLTWNANTESDLDGYMVLRAQQDKADWNTIARKVPTNHYVDNTCRQGVSYIYKVKAIDKAGNLSEASATAAATPTGEPSLIARWHFDGDTYDETANMMDAALKGSAAYADDHKSGSQSLSLDGNSFLQLPYEVAGSDELTVAMWVKWTKSTNWQRLFDFGIDTEHYMFLTPANSYTGVIRFAIKNGGDEQFVDCRQKLTLNQWKHVAVSIGNGKTAIYVDGEELASSTGITIRPSDIRPVLNYIGRSQFNADPLLSGCIDDVRIYNYALDGQALKLVMNDLTNGIDSPQRTDAQSGHRIYGLDGQRRPAVRPGLNIIDGQKRLVKRP